MGGAVVLMKTRLNMLFIVTFQITPWKKYVREKMSTVGRKGPFVQMVLDADTN